jgi:prolipoprotein diacylglyceryltransferase
MPGPFIHHIDPVLGRVGGVYLWWYGLGYAAAFTELLLYLWCHRERLRLTEAEAYALTLMFAAGALAGGRTVQMAGDE